MKKFIFLIVCFLASVAMAHAQECETPIMKIYCDVKCERYNLLKDDVNATVDFGIADKAIDARGWIYNPETNKKMSFASPMNVFAYMAKKGWEYKDAIIINSNSDNIYVWHFILTKEMPVDCTAADIIGDIDYRKK